MPVFRMLGVLATAMVMRVMPVGAQQAVTAFVNVSVIPMDREQVLAGQTVIVRGHTIAEMGPAAQIKVPASAIRVDGQGKFLMPGLGDMHAHFFPTAWEDRKGIQEWYASPRLFCYVANGVTTIRVLEHEDTAFAGIRRQVAKGLIVGPRIALAAVVEQSNRDGSIPEYITAVKGAGYDFVRLSWFTQETFDTMVTASVAAGMRLTGELPNVIDFERALSLPYGSIDHLQGYLRQLEPGTYIDPRLGESIVWDSVLRRPDAPKLDESKIPALVAATQRAGVWNIPMQAYAERTLDLWAGPGRAKDSPILKLRQRLIHSLQKAGAGLLLGTDAPTWGGQYGAAVHQELAALVASGLTPYQALETGTRNVAAFLKTTDSAGTIAAGKWADLVLLSGNPLEDIRNAARPMGVMVNGQWLPRTKIDAQLKTQDCSIR